MTPLFEREVQKLFINQQPSSPKPQSEASSQQNKVVNVKSTEEIKEPGGQEAALMGEEKDNQSEVSEPQQKNKKGEKEALNALSKADKKTRDKRDVAILN